MVEGTVPPVPQGIRPTPKPTDAPLPRIAVKLVPRNVDYEHNLGHMGVMWRIGSTVIFRGFRFRLIDLPKEYRAPSRWRDYLFKNRIAGYVANDIILQDALCRIPAKVWCVHWDVETQSVEKIAIAAATGRRGWYSFNPDDYPNCHNCVTWTTLVVNEVFLGEVLPSVPNGRMKRAIEMLLQAGAHPSLCDIGDLGC